MMAFSVDITYSSNKNSYFGVCLYPNSGTWKDCLFCNIQGVSGGIVNVLGGGSMDYS
jgi:hypothetical protein